MASFASQAALRTHYEDLIDSTETDITDSLKSAVSWLKQVLNYFSIRALKKVNYVILCTNCENALYVFIIICVWQQHKYEFLIFFKRTF